MSEPRTFKCDMCKGTFEAGWSHEEAAAEAKAHHGIDDVADKANVACVCDDCYEKMPEARVAALTKVLTARFLRRPGFNTRDPRGADEIIRFVRASEFASDMMVVVVDGVVKVASRGLYR